MNYNKKTVRDFDAKGKKVLLRCDFNVPQNKETGEITSDKRIVAALPTIKYLLENGAAVIACSHLGKPKGEWKEKLSLKPVAARLSELLGMDVIMAADIIGEDAKAKAAALQPGQLMLLEKPPLRQARGEERPRVRQGARLHGRRVRVRRLRHRAPRARLHRRRGRLLARLCRTAGRERKSPSWARP